MKICFYAPFKPLGHPHPSGDLATATGIFEYLTKQGHQVDYASTLRCRWIYWRPWLWPRLLWERQRVVRRFASASMDLWFTYHSYYKAPDMLGPSASKKMQLPYVIFQGIYSTKHRRRYRTRPGFHLNTAALRAAAHVFVNKKVDLLNIKRVLPEERVTYVPPGISPEDFSFDPNARDELRRQWGVGDEPVIFSAAMFRPGPKTEGLGWVIRVCSELQRQHPRFRLVIAGDGKERQRLRKLAGDRMQDTVRFVGKIAHTEMARFYSAADVFVYPGIREPLGLVYLEAQSCGLPVVAFDNAGVPEAVRNGETGLLVPVDAFEAYVDAVRRLLLDKELRLEMGRTAQSYVRQAHDLSRNYRALEKMLQKIVDDHPLQ